MRKSPTSLVPKILLRGAGVGTLTEADVERRAKEIAEVAGRNRVRALDRRQAREELSNAALPRTTGDQAVAERGVSRDPAEPVSRRGQRVRTAPDNDLQKDLERLVVEGVEEADHEQRVASRRRRGRKL